MEVLFQGKRIEGDGWAQGFPVLVDGRTFILKDVELSGTFSHNGGLLSFNTIEVDFDTLSRYSGFTDIEHNKIFEHSILACEGHLFAVRFGRCGKGYEGFYLVGHDDETTKKISQGLRDDIAYWVLGKSTKVVGNELDLDEEYAKTQIEFTKFQAECLAEFLRTEFIKYGKGIGSNPDLKDHPYVAAIHRVYDKLQEVTKSDD